MRHITILFFLFWSLYAQEPIKEEQKQKLTIGLGIYGQTQPYKAINPIIVPSPVIFFDNGLFYIRWSRAGMYFLGDKGKDVSWGFSLTAQPRTFGYETKGITDLVGLNSRKTTIEGGLAFSVLYHKTSIEVMLLTDLLKKYDTWLVKTEIGDEFALGDFTFYPSLIMSYQSDAFVNYYYGITQEESQRTHFNFFKPRGGFQVGAQTFINYDITDSIAVLVNARVDSIPKSAHVSPLLKDTLIYSGLLSLIYTFEY